MVGGKWIAFSDPPLAPQSFVDHVWFKYILSVISATVAEGSMILYIKLKRHDVILFQFSQPHIH